MPFAKKYWGEMDEYSGNNRAEQKTVIFIQEVK
jgi:hypothetical protein